MDEYRSSASIAGYPAREFPILPLRNVPHSYMADRANIDGPRSESGALHRNRSSSAPRPSTAPARQGRDSILTTTGTSSSIYPPSTSSAETPSEPISPSSTGPPMETFISDTDDVSFRLKLLIRNNYFLPPAHTKPALNLSSLATPPIEDSPKKSPISPSFSALFRKARKERSLPEVRTNGIHDTTDPHKPVASPRPSPPTPRVVVIREPLLDIKEAAIQSEYREEIRRQQNHSTPPMLDYFDLDPTDAVDIDPPLAHQPSNLSAGAMASRVPPTPEMSSLWDDTEGAWRKALLEEAVGLSMSSIPPPTPSNTPLRSSASRAGTQNTSLEASTNSRPLSTRTSASAPIHRTRSVESVPTPRSKRDLGQRLIASVASTSSLPYHGPRSGTPPEHLIGQRILPELESTPVHPKTPSPAASLSPSNNVLSPTSFYTAHSHPPSPITPLRVETPPAIQPLAPPPRRRGSPAHDVLTPPPSRASPLPIARFSPALIIEDPDGEMRSFPSIDTVSSGSIYSDDFSMEHATDPVHDHDGYEDASTRSVSMSLRAGITGNIRHSFETFGARRLSSVDSEVTGVGEDGVRLSLSARRTHIPRSLTLAPPTLQHVEPPPASPASFFDQVEAQAMEEDSETETETETDDGTENIHGPDDFSDEDTHRFDSHTSPPGRPSITIPVQPPSAPSSPTADLDSSIPFQLGLDNGSSSTLSSHTSRPYSALDPTKPLTNAPPVPRPSVFSSFIGAPNRKTPTVIEEEQFERLKYAPPLPSPTASSVTTKPRFYTVGNTSEGNVASSSRGRERDDEREKEIRRWRQDQQIQNAALRKLDGMVVQHIEAEKEAIKKITSGAGFASGSTS